MKRVRDFLVNRDAFFSFLHLALQTRNSTKHLLPLTALAIDATKNKIIPRFSSDKTQNDSCAPHCSGKH